MVRQWEYYQLSRPFIYQKTFKTFDSKLGIEWFKLVQGAYGFKVQHLNLKW